MKISKILNLIATLIIVVIVIVCGALVVPKVFGYKMYGILSGSMEPKYPVGSLIYVEPVEPSEIQVGDVITFKMAAESDVVATHRVVAKNDETSSFTTKGDNNQQQDSSPVSYERLIGRVVLCIPMLGYIAQFVQSSAGMVAGISAIVLVFVLWFLADYLKKDKVTHSNN